MYILRLDWLMMICFEIWTRSESLSSLSPPSQMPHSFDLINKVEQFIRRGTFPADATRSSKAVTRSASKHFTYKGILGPQLSTLCERHKQTCIHLHVIEVEAENVRQNWTNNTRTVCMVRLGLVEKIHHLSFG